MKHATARASVLPAAILVVLIPSLWLLSVRDNQVLPVYSTLECDETNDLEEQEDKVLFARPTLVSVEPSHVFFVAAFPLWEPLEFEPSRVHLRGPPLA